MSMSNTERYVAMMPLISNHGLAQSQAGGYRCMVSEEALRSERSAVIEMGSRAHLRLRNGDYAHE